MKNKQAAVLWEHTWRRSYEFMPDDEREFVLTFRIVAWSWEHGDGVRRIGALHCEEQTNDCMGQPIWRITDDERVPPMVLAVLLQEAGRIPADADLSDVP